MVCTPRSGLGAGCGTFLPLLEGGSVADSEQAGIVWRKSTASESGNCVEVAFFGESVLMRHSQEHSERVLTFSLAEWTAFVTGVHLGEFDPL